jgi:aspartate-semialdehyde dehydrogenase
MEDTPRLRAAILGATGAVGQKFVARLAGHPWFEIAALCASERSRGKLYGEAVHWLEGETLAPEIAATRVREAELEALADLAVDIVFSALDAGSAQQLEPLFVEAGYAVFTNASAHRLSPGVPLLVPEVNADHLRLVEDRPPGRGFLVANPNCSTAGLVCALAPLDTAFGVEAVSVTTLQAVSGAGYPGLPALDILGNVIPWIAGEEEKIEREPRKILGALRAGEIVPAAFRIAAQTNRVAVLDGHLLNVSVKLARAAPIEAVREAFAGFGNPLADLELPSAPRRLLHLLDRDDSPQPRLHAGLEGGMAVAIGRLRPCPLFDVRFVALVHNTVRGAAGGAILNAELAPRWGVLGQVPSPSGRGLG